MSRQDRPQKAVSTGIPPQPPELARGRCVSYPQKHLWCSHNVAEVEAAKRICAGCPVVVACATWALSLRPVDDQIMTLGGLSAPERREIRQQRARQRAWVTRKRNAAA